MRERVDAISYYMDDLVGWTTQAIIGMMMLGDDRISSLMNKSSSSDIEYLRKIAMTSIKSSSMGTKQSQA